MIKVKKIIQLRGELCVVERVRELLAKEIVSTQYAIDYYYKKVSALELEMSPSFSCTNYTFPYNVEMLYKITMSATDYKFYKKEQDDAFHTFEDGMDVDTQGNDFTDRFWGIFYDTAEVLQCF